MAVAPFRAAPFSRVLGESLDHPRASQLIDDSRSTDLLDMLGEALLGRLVRPDEAHFTTPFERRADGDLKF